MAAGGCRRVVVGELMSGARREGAADWRVDERVVAEGAGAGVITRYF